MASLQALTSGDCGETPLFFTVHEIIRRRRITFLMKLQSTSEGTFSASVLCRGTSKELLLLSGYSFTPLLRDKNPSSVCIIAIRYRLLVIQSMQSGLFYCTKREASVNVVRLAALSCSVYCPANDNCLSQYRIIFDFAFLLDNNQTPFVYSNFHKINSVSITTFIIYCHWLMKTCSSLTKKSITVTNIARYFPFFVKIIYQNN